MRSALFFLAQVLGLAAALPSGPAQHASSTENSASTVHRNARAASSSNWWLPNIENQTDSASRDYVPNLGSDYDYQVYFAIESGDTQGFLNAISGYGPNGGPRAYNWIAGQPRVIYLASGTYTFDSTFYLVTDIVIIGDPNDPPVLSPSSNFNADNDFFMVGGQNETNTGRGGESRFSILLKNIILDTTPQASNTGLTALSWRTAQNTGLVNVQIKMPPQAHTGLWVGQGSPVSVSDVTFYNGNIGLHYQNAQQAQLKNMQFNDCTTGIQITAGYTISIIAPRFNTVGSSIVLASNSPYVSVVDATSVNSGNFFTTTSAGDYPNFVLDNISKDTTDSAMVIVNGKTIFGGITKLSTYVYGNTVGQSTIYQTGSATQSIPRPTALTGGSSNNTFPIVTAPQYADKTVDDVINLKDSSQNGGNTLMGDGSNDDTYALQEALNTAASAGKIAFLPFGIYLVNTTITIPLGTNLVGNAWSTISGYGQTFKTETSPTPVVQVGNSGDKGTIQIQDMRFTVHEELPGAIILQVNAAGTNPGDVAIYNSLITVGGTRDTTISCSQESQCAAAYYGLHLAEGSSAYVDNFWSWVADHPSDGEGMGINIAAKGGVQVDSTVATWFSGLASEHWWLFNYNHNNAENVLTTFFQSETNYYQNDGSAPPAPFTPTSSDPDFSYCDSSDNDCFRTVNQYFNGGGNQFVYGAGSWTFDDGPQEAVNVINAFPDPMYLFGMCGLGVGGAGDGSGASNLFRLPNGTEFAKGKSDGYSGSWGLLVTEYVHDSSTN